MNTRIHTARHRSESPFRIFRIPKTDRHLHLVRVRVTVSPDNKGLLTAKSADVILANGGDYLPGSRVEKYNQASGYLRQLLTWLGIPNVNIILASSARAGTNDETAIENYGTVIESAAARDLAAPVAEAP